MVPVSADYETRIMHTTTANKARSPFCRRGCVPVQLGFLGDTENDLRKIATGIFMGEPGGDLE